MKDSRLHASANLVTLVNAGLEGHSYRSPAAELKQSHRHLSGWSTNIQTHAFQHPQTPVQLQNTQPATSQVKEEKKGRLRGNVTHVGEGEWRQGREEQSWPLVKCLVFHEQAASSYTLPETLSLRRGFKEHVGPSLWYVFFSKWRFHSQKKKF